MQRWEYKLVPVDGRPGLEGKHRKGGRGKGLMTSEDLLGAEELNELGREGWEAVTMTLAAGVDVGMAPVLLLKRPIED